MFLKNINLNLFEKSIIATNSKLIKNTMTNRVLYKIGRFNYKEKISFNQNKYQNNFQLFKDQSKNKFSSNFYKISKKNIMDFDPAKDYYKILGINHSANEKDIKIAYHKLAKKYHPDLNKGKTTDAFKEMTAAYDILSDKEKRKQYDEYRKMFNQGESRGYSQQSQNNSYENPFSQQNYENFYKNSQKTNNTSNSSSSSSSSGTSKENFNKSYSKTKTTYTFRDPKTGEYKTYTYDGDTHNNPFFKDFEDFMKKFNQNFNQGSGGPQYNQYKDNFGQQNSGKSNFNEKFNQSNFQDPFHNFKSHNTQQNKDPRMNWQPNWHDHDYHNMLYARKIFSYIFILTAFIVFISIIKRRNRATYYDEEMLSGFPYGEINVNMSPYPPPQYNTGPRNNAPPVYNNYNSAPYNPSIQPPAYNLNKGNVYDDPYVNNNVRVK